MADLRLRQVVSIITSASGDVEVGEDARSYSATLMMPPGESGDASNHGTIKQTSPNNVNQNVPVGYSLNNGPNCCGRMKNSVTLRATGNAFWVVVTNG